MQISNTTTSRLTREKAADALGVTVKTLRIWELKTWFPEGGRTTDGYNVAAIAAARPKSDVEREAETESPLRRSAREAEHVKTIEDAKHAKARRETAELKLRTAQGELVPRTGFKQSYADLLTGVGTRKH